MGNLQSIDPLADERVVFHSRDLHTDDLSDISFRTWERHADAMFTVAGDSFGAAAAETLHQHLFLHTDETCHGFALTFFLSCDQALDAVCAPVSLYDPVYSDGGDPLTVMDQVRDTKNTEGSWMEHIALRDAFRALNDRERQILSLRFYDGKTQMEVAGALGISQAQVSRLEKGAISSMRKSVSVS